MNFFSCSFFFHENDIIYIIHPYIIKFLHNFAAVPIYQFVVDCVSIDDKDSCFKICKKCTLLHFIRIFSLKRVFASRCYWQLGILINIWLDFITELPFLPASHWSLTLHHVKCVNDLYLFALSLINQETSQKCLIHHCLRFILASNCVCLLFFLSERSKELKISKLILICMLGTGSPLTCMFHYALIWTGNQEGHDLEDGCKSWGILIRKQETLENWILWSKGCSINIKKWRDQLGIPQL